MAVQDIPRYNRKPYKDLSGGLATRADALQIPASQFVQLDNALCADHDILEKAPGYILDGSPWPATAGTSVSGGTPGTSINLPAQMRINVDGDGAQTINFNSGGNGGLNGANSASTNVSGTIGVNIDGDGVQTVTISGANGTAINNSLYAAVVALTPLKSTTAPWAFLMWNTVFDAVNTRYLLNSGSAGVGSSVVITETGSGVATALKLTSGAGATPTAGSGTYPAFGSSPTPGPTIASAIGFLTRQLTAINPANQASLRAVTGSYVGNVYTITSGSTGPSSSVVITNGLSNDTANALKLGVANGGTETAGSLNPDSFIRMLVNYRVGTSVNSLVVAAQDDANTNATYKVDLKQTFGDGNYNYIGYTTGTSLFTSGSNAVVGTGTAYNTQLKAGDKIGTGAHPSIWYTIQSITDATHLTLSSNYNETTTTSTNYMARIILNLNNTPLGLVFNNKLIITNGSEKMMEFDNTTMSLITDANAPLANFLEKHKNRVFAANTSASPSGLAWSKTNDETVWNAASIASVFPQDNGQCVMIRSFGDSLLYFKDNGIIYRVTGDFDQDVVGAPTSIKKLDCPDNLGIIAGRSIVINDDNNLYFSCETGLYTIDPYWFQIKKVSWDVSPTLANLIFRATSSAAKQYVYATQAQWNTGTHSGTRSNTSNQLTTYNDRQAITGVLMPGTTIPGTSAQSQTPYAGCIDASNNAHAAYLAGLSGSGAGAIATVTYTRYGADLSLITESLFSVGVLFNSGMAIAMSSSGQPGICFAWRDSVDNPHIMYTERITAGTASFTAGSNNVTGQGTSWQTGATPLTAGSLIKNAIDGTFAVVQTVNSDTSITLTANYAGTTSITSAYVSWSNPVNADNTAAYAFTICAVDLRFNGTEPKILVAYNLGGACYYSRVAGVYTRTSITTNSGNATQRASLYVNGSNISAAFTNDNATIHVYTSSNGGSSFSLLENWSVTFASNGTGYAGIEVARDGGGNTITAYSTGGSIVKRNHSTTTTTTLDATANSFFGGYSYYNGNDYWMNIAGNSPAQVERYGFLTSSNVADVVANRLQASPVPTSRGMDNNGAVFLSIATGTNSNEVVLRRISFQATWTSPKQSDSTLSVWGTYVVTGEVDNGATVLQQIALGASSTLGAPTTITNGSIISTDATKVFYQVTVTMTIATLNAPVIGSIVLNYQGAGASSTAQFAFVFNNEMYLTATEQGNTTNNVTIFYDRKHAFYRWTTPVSMFARMNQTLYGGSSNSGNVYRMRNGYSMNGAAYTMTAVTKEDMLGSLELQKEVSKIYVLFKVQTAGTFTFSYRLDNYKNPAGSVWVDKKIDQTKSGIAEIPVNCMNLSSLQMKITQGDAGINCQIVGAIVMFGYLDVR